ncbi:MAG: hypothetical protein M1831_002406 [Alyxoria varia]|nr:MAG: hypothetical protein M1831_002406 [Alyxoria varia]
MLYWIFQFVDWKPAFVDRLVAYRQTLSKYGDRLDAFTSYREKLNRYREKLSNSGMWGEAIRRPSETTRVGRGEDEEGEKRKAKWAANATLNFGAVIAVAPEDSPRLPSLIEAANLTGIDIQVPHQPKWTAQSVNFWRTMESKDHKGAVGASPGTAKGGLGHLNALKWFVDSGMETALILEDDVDWDIELRTKQIPRLAQSLRTHLQKNATQQSGFMSQGTGPWGNTSAWDLLHIGHAGDFGVNAETSATPKDVSHSPEYLAAMQHAVYRDDTLPSSHDIHPLMRPYLRSMGIIHNHRVLQEPRRNLNSWAYALTRRAAVQMLETAKNHTETNNPFDVFLMRSCIGTNSYDNFTHKPYLRCWVLNPQLFHHQFHLSESLITGSLSMASIDAAGYAQAKERWEVPNVRCGARSGAFHWKIGVQLDIFGDEEQERLELLQREVVGKGQCLKDWKQRFNISNYVDVEQPTRNKDLRRRGNLRQ